MMLLSDTDLEPWSFLIHSLLGRLIPIAVLGARSPLSTITVIAFAVIPFTFFFLCSGIKGELSSNHCDWSAIAFMRLVSSISFIDTTKRGIYERYGSH